MEKKFLKENSSSNCYTLLYVTIFINFYVPGSLFPGLWLLEVVPSSWSSAVGLSNSNCLSTIKSKHRYHLKSKSKFNLENILERLLQSESIASLKDVCMENYTIIFALCGFNPFSTKQEQAKIKMPLRQY